MDPEPTVVPVKLTKQLPAGDSAQLLALREPPVVPAVKAKLTLPPGVFEAVVVSMTVEVTLGRIVLGVQVTAVDVLSFDRAPYVPSTFVVTMVTPLPTMLVFIR